MPPRNVVPKPVQKPHPPLWVACSRRDTILLAAEKGIGALTFAFIDPEEAVHWVADYEPTLAEKCVPVGKAVNANVACVTPDDVRARPRRRPSPAASRAATSSATRSATTTSSATTSPARTDVWQEFIEQRATSRATPPTSRPPLERGAPRRQGRRRRHHRPAGRHRHARPDPRVPPPLRGGRRRPAHLRDAGGQEPPRAHHGEPIELFGTRGAARVQGARRGPRDGQGQAARADHRGGAWPARSTTRPPLPDGYSFPAMPRTHGRRQPATSRPRSGSRSSPRRPPPATHGGLRPDQPVARRMAYTVISLAPRRSSVSSTMTPNSTSVPPSR